MSTDEICGLEENQLYRFLRSLGVCAADSVEEFYPRVRDRADVAVLRCRRSGVIFLSRTDHLAPSRHLATEGLNYWNTKTREEAVLSCLADDRRRASFLMPWVANKRWLDFGTGVGGLLDLLVDHAAAAYAVEPQPGPRRMLQDAGYQVFAGLEDVTVEALDVVTMFHVLEHLVDPVGVLKALRVRLVPGGRIVVELPHARDFLVTFLDNEAFKAFTFWSEHTVLHTRESLRLTMEAAGFTHVVVEGVQRYPISNHLHWLAKGKPGGHQCWGMLDTPEMNMAYAQMLNRLDFTDTLIAIGEK
ncbi:MAG: hypothetical protein A3K19_13060 [Lentisphaerae bacterium RIFOXYB12_FULL_65_16]|nr:MAG: hypothetical protein A3K18_04645 [Lentisphaerae bacterium RIFOXYA12_64_32]OGV87239.1 MAG: hypothetical protein A3K19_13060 [Lentisphaerae bacterium RIFOXYB12_FULL_65_16]